MSIKNYLNIPESEKNRLWQIFYFEEMLFHELEYCEHKIKSIKPPYTALDIAMLTIYQRHKRNLLNLMDNLHRDRSYKTGISPISPDI